MTIETLATVRIGDRGLTALRVNVDGLNKRAARHGMEPMAVTVTRTVQFFPLRYRKSDGTRYIGCASDLHDVEITGQAPRINGWALAACIDFTTEIGTVVKIAPGRDDDGSFETYRTHNGACEHCNTNRRRNDVFVLENEDGRRKVVGRNCLADFLRCKGADAFARYAEYADKVRELVRSDGADESDYYGGGCGPTATRLETYLPVVSALMKKVGWVSRTASREADGGMATADLAWVIISPRNSYDRKLADSLELEVCAADHAIAARATEWARNVDVSGNEYLYTISQIAHKGEVAERGLDGYAASIIIAYRKACEREALEAERKARNKNKVWFGTEKKREKGLRVTCKGLHTFEGHYGPTTIVRFEHRINDNDVAVLVWFASGARENDWEVDEDYTIDATVKGHDDHEKYGKQTKINRVKAHAA